MDNEVESILHGFVELNAKQQAECMHVLAQARHGDKVERALGDRAANELLEDDQFERGHYDRNF